MPMPGVRVVVLTVTTLALAGCASRSSPAAAPAAPVPPAIGATAPFTKLRADLSSLFGASDLAHAHVGVLIRSLLTGETLHAQNEQQLFVPASNQKLLTVAAAARRLGWDFRYTTRIVATGTVKPDGTLDGDLIVAGSGDPTINPRHPERWRALDEWAAEIAARGVRVIGGHLIGDDNRFAEPGWGAGWSWDDLAADYGSPIGALQYHENEAEILVGPGMQVGSPAIVATAPLGHGLLVDNQVVTTAADAATQIAVERAPGTILLTVRGTIALGSPARRRVVAVDNPTKLLLTAFREALSRKGIFVAGSVADIDELPNAPAARRDSSPDADRTERRDFSPDSDRTERRDSSPDPGRTERRDASPDPGRTERRDASPDPGRTERRDSSPGVTEPDRRGETWIVDRSAPLYEIVDPILKWSRNGYAETLLWTLPGRDVIGSDTAGLTVLREELAAMQVEPPLYAAFDGSGLSRYDMVSPEALVRLLTAVWNDATLIGPFREALPVAGRSGSLANQMKGTPAEGRVWAKTGSMFNIRSISGYVLTADNEPLAFSFLANNYTVPSAQVEAMYEKALEQLAAFRR